MNRANIELEIQELVLAGFAPKDRDRIAEAFRFELTRLLAKPDGVAIGSVSESLRVDAGSFRAAPGIRADSIGIQAARTVFKGLQVDTHVRTQLKPEGQPAFTPQRAGLRAQPATRGPDYGPLPPGVVEALASRGQPIENSIRKPLESQLGHDFSGVRVHSDGPAAESTRELNALAYTVGTDIVIGDRPETLTSSQGQNLLAHELAHVVQQKGDPAGPGLQRAPRSYDNTGFNLTPPPQPFTLADAQALVEKRKTAATPEIKSAAVKGATTGSTEEIFLWLIIAMVGKRDRWGTEVDMVAPIGWPAKPGDPAPLGKVTVTLSTDGDAIAELLSAGPVAQPSLYADRAAAETALKTTYGIAAVIDGDTAWKPEELNNVGAAFALLPAADKTALAGVTLMRVASIDGGKTAGEFGSSQSVSQTTVTNEATLKLADKAFAADPTNFVGGKSNPSPASFLTIVHEVGHAVASKAKRNAVFAHHQAIAKSNEAVAALNVAVGVRNSATDEFNKLVGEYNGLVGIYNDSLKAGDSAATAAAKKAVVEKKKEVDAKELAVTALKADEDKKRNAFDASKKVVETKKALAEATRISSASLRPFQDAAVAEKAKAATALKAATGAAAGFSADDATASESYRNAVSEATKAIEDYAAAGADADLDALEKTVQMSFDARNIARGNLKTAAATNPALDSFAPVELTQDSWFKAERARARAADRTKRVQAFVVFVNANKIAPFTEYARENWPLKPEEFFAEAYSLWRTDPEYLKANAKALFDWLEAGSYRI